ncbi:hypothetical protein NF212_10050 [Parasalinivibrio latis]|uniref:hypothetical protein n=1 Tax=Parasalinivibrio latis TaxID=2952610 RepID=UPI0030E5095F
MTMISRSFTTFSVSLLMVIGLSACTDHPPVSVDKCGEVVRHAKSVLGGLAPDTATLLRQCQTATDSERGCVMAATTKGALSQCL